MNRIQWLVLGIGLSLLGIFLIKLALGICLVEDTAIFVGCMVRRYAYAVPAMIIHALGLLFIICGFLEPKKKAK
jgi:hypothetical protein